MKYYNINTMQGMILMLQNYWYQQGCIIVQPIDIEVGAGTLHPITFLHATAMKKKKVFFAYVQSSRRPVDGRYANNHSHRLQHYYQFQVILKPTPKNIQDIYLNSLKKLKINLHTQDIRFVEDNWENPTLGAWGLGWEVWLNGMEITQFTYFQQMGSIDCNPVIGEITYGLERLGLYVQNVNSIYDLVWSKNNNTVITYGDLFLQNEKEQSIYNFEHINIKFLFISFKYYIREINYLLSLKNPLIFPAYELFLKANHVFNVLDSRKVISVLERQRYILMLRNITKLITEIYLQRNCNYDKDFIERKIN